MIHFVQQLEQRLVTLNQVNQVDDGQQFKTMWHNTMAVVNWFLAMMMAQAIVVQVAVGSDPSSGADVWR